MSADLADGARFRAEEQRAIASLAGWIGHPAIPPIIREASLPAAMAAKALERLLTSQKEIIWFCLSVFELAPVEPGWQRTSHLWQLNPIERAAINSARAGVRVVVVAVADALAAAGVRLEPSWPGDLAVIAQLLLLEATGHQVPWDSSPRELAEALQPPANCTITIDGSGSFQRRWASERAERNTTSLRRDYEKHLHGPRRRAAYAGGGTRAVPRKTEARRAALRQVLEAFPEATAPRITKTYHHASFRSSGKNQGRPATPGGYLRALLGDAGCPSKSTLAKDLRIIRPAGSGESVEE